MSSDFCHLSYTLAETWPQPGRNLIAPNARWPDNRRVSNGAYIPATLDIVDAVGSPNVGLLFDAGHLFQSPNLMADLEIAGSRISGVPIDHLWL